MKNQKKIISIARFLSKTLLPNATDPGKESKIRSKQSKTSGMVKINSNLNVKKITNVQQTIAIQSGTINGSYRVIESLRSTKIITKTATAETFYTHRITGKKGTIFFLGDVIVTRMRTEHPVTLDSFLQAKERSWLLHSHDHFEDDKEIKWKGANISSCDSLRGYYYGGHCNLASNEISRSFHNISRHSKIMIKSTFHYFDNWQGELAYMKVNGETVWMKSGVYPKNSKSLFGNCGNEDYNDPLINQSNEFNSEKL